MSIFQKVRVATLAAVNEVADGAINKMPLPVLKQKIRDLEAAQGEMHDQMSVQKGNILDAEGEVKVLGSKIAAETAMLTKIATNKGKTDPAVQAKASLVVGLQSQLKTKQDTLASLNTMYDKMKQGAIVVDAKHTEALERLHTLESVTTDTKALQAGVKASKAIQGIVGDSVDGLDLASLDKKITHDHNVATAQFDSATEAFHVPEPEVDAEHAMAIDDLLNTLPIPETAAVAK